MVCDHKVLRYLVTSVVLPAELNVVSKTYIFALPYVAMPHISLLNPSASPLVTVWEPALVTDMIVPFGV